MAQFIALNKRVEVDAQTVLAVINSMEKGKDRRTQVLLDTGINLKKAWINQQHWLEAFKAIHTQMGDMNLFLIGKAIIDNAKFPPIEGLEGALRSLDVAYHMNHRLDGKVMFNESNGAITSGIGNYKLVEFDADNKKAVMVCSNPYPSKFDEGIITQLVIRFKPKGSRYPTVEPDYTKETRTNGGDSCTFNVNW